MLLKADGVRPVQIIPLVKPLQMRRADFGPFNQQPYVGSEKQ
jgi:hypothetical protein